MRADQRMSLSERPHGSLGDVRVPEAEGLKPCGCESIDELDVKGLILSRENVLRKVLIKVIDELIPRRIHLVRGRLDISLRELRTRLLGTASRSECDAPKRPTGGRPTDAEARCWAGADAARTEPGRVAGSDSHEGHPGGREHDSRAEH